MQPWMKSIGLSCLGIALVGTGIAVWRSALAEELPTVTIQATDNIATEGSASAKIDPTPGVFTFTRTGGTDGDLSVSVSTGGEDCGQVTIPAGASSTTMAITPMDEGTEEAYDMSYSIAANPNYVVGTPSSAVISVRACGQ